MIRSLTSVSYFRCGFAASIRATDKISPRTQPPIPRGSNQKGLKGVSARLGTGKLRRGGGIPLWTLGWVAGFDPEENPLPKIALSPGHEAPVPRGGHAALGRLAPPERKARQGRCGMGMPPDRCTQGGGKVSATAGSD